MWSNSRWLSGVSDPVTGLLLLPSLDSGVVSAGRRFQGRVELRCTEGVHELATGEPQLGFLFDEQGRLVGEYHEMLSGYGLDITLRPGESAWLDFLASAVLPGPVDEPAVPTPPGRYSLRVAVSLLQYPGDGGPASETHVLSSPVDIVVAPVGE